MKPTSNAEQRIQQSPNELVYQKNEVQGECLLLRITPVVISTPFFVLYVICSIIFVGVPLLLTYWYPWLKRIIYYRPSPLAEAKYFHIINYDEVSTYCQKLEANLYFTRSNSENVTYFVNRYLTYIIQNNVVRPASFDFISRCNSIMESPNIQKESYNSQKDAYNLRQSFGTGVMQLEFPSIPMLFFKQVMRPLYLFILFSCSLWVYQMYYYFSGIIFITALIGIITSLYQTYQNNKKMHQMAYHQEEVEVMRNGEVISLSSKELVPGDIVFLKKQIKIPFDGIILEGQALINQCALTGQSVPILKKPQKLIRKEDLKTSYIYEGTFLIQVGNKKKFLKFDHYRQKFGVPVVVARTNFSTMKGQLIRVISFPRQRENVFEKESAKFLIFLFILSCVSYIILLVKLTKTVQDGNKLFVKFLDLITITVPPGLPVSMTFGIIFALEKMKDKKIFCSSPNKVIHGGLTNWVCFDKTGTLTEDFMDFECLLLYDGKFREPIYNRKESNINEEKIGQLINQNPNLLIALNNMAMNHTIVRVQQTGENVGDPMQIKLFEFGQFKFSNAYNDRADIIMAFESLRGHNGIVLKRFDFDSQLFRMSAIGRSNVTQNELIIYVKGSPQIMIDIFRKETVPTNYDQVLKEYASQGFRILAIGSRKIQSSEINNPRLQLENKLDFNGFQVFQNRLKPETKAAIKELVEAELPCVMITGDNALTGSNMACQCGISDPAKKTLICNFDPHKNGIIFEEFSYKSDKQIDYQPRKIPTSEQFFSQDLEKTDNKIKNDLNVGSIQQELPPPNLLNKEYQILNERLKNPNIQLCLTGATLNNLFPSNSVQNLSNIQQYILLRTTVFARAKPNDKIKAISLYQKLGKKVSMCGDGANDCGALKQADIGLSLSMAEASIAAPFTSQITNISSMVQLLKECRAGLATNFSLFNIMALYSLIQYTTTIITQYYFAYPWDLQYLYWDIFCNFLFFLTIGYTKTADKLSVSRPNGSLFAVSNLVQVLLIFGIQLMGQLLVMVGLTQTYASDIGYTSDQTQIQFQEDGQTFVTESPENSVLFYFTNIMYISTLLAFSISKPWRKQFFTNPLFMIVLIIMLTYSLIFIVVPEARLEVLKAGQITHMPLLWYIFGLALGIGVFIYILQKFMLEPFFHWLRSKIPNTKWL